MSSDMSQIPNDICRTSSGFDEIPEDICRVLSDIYEESCDLGEMSSAISEMSSAISEVPDVSVRNTLAVSHALVARLAGLASPANLIRHR